MNPISNKSEIRPAKAGTGSLPFALSDSLPGECANVFKPGRLLVGLLGWLGQRGCPRRRLVVLERLSLAPRQTLWLVEAEGTRLLLASSVGGGLTFLELDRKNETSEMVRGAGASGDPSSLRVHNALPRSSASWDGRRG